MFGADEITAAQRAGAANGQADSSLSCWNLTFSAVFAPVQKAQKSGARFARLHYLYCVKTLLVLLAACSLLFAFQRPAQAQASWGIPPPFPFLFYNSNQGYQQPYYGGQRVYYGQGYYCRPGYCTPSRRAYFYRQYYRPRYYYRPQYYQQSYFGPNGYYGPDWGGYGGW